MPSTLKMPTPTQLAETMKLEISYDIASGKVPPTIMSFSALHDYVDANCYGHQEMLLEAGCTLDELCAVANRAMDIVDAWIKSGGARK